MRFLAIILGLFVILAGALVVAPSFIDWNKYKTQILAQLHAATGHEYKIDGNLKIAVLPFPHAVVQGLEVATGSKKLLVMKEASVNVALMPLLQGKVVVDSVVLMEPQITLEVATDGTASWMTPELSAKMEKKDGAQPAQQNEMMNSIALEQISVKDAKFSYADRRTGKTMAMDGISFALHGDSLFGPYTLDGESIYMGKKVKIGLKSGKIDNASESLSLQANAEFPELATLINYSGVMALKNSAAELQGETSFQTENLATFMAAFGDEKSKPAPALAKPVRTKGILPYTPEGAAYKNLTVNYAGTDMTGSIMVTGLAKKAPLAVSADLSATKALVLDGLLPPPATDKKPMAGFLPETLNFPFDIALDVALAAPSVQYKSAAFSNVKLALDKKAGIIKTQVTAEGPGDTDVDLDSVLTYASASTTEKTGAVTLSDPTAIIDTNIKSGEPDKMAALFMPADKLAGMKGVLSKSISLNGKITVKPKRVETEATTIGLLGDTFNTAGSYALKARNGRDVLTFGAAANSIDFDAWMKTIAPEKKTATAVQPQAGESPTAAAGKALSNIAASIKLPFDLNMEATSGSIRFHGAQYDKLAVKGNITGNVMQIDTLSLQDTTGNNFSISGNIGDIAALKKIDLSVAGATPDLQKLLEGFKVKAESLPKDAGAAEMVTEFKGDSQKLAFTSNVKALRGTLEASGDVSELMSTPVLSSLTMRLRHPSYVDLARMFNPSFSSGAGIKKTLDVYGVMEKEQNGYKFSQLKAAIGPATISGNVGVNMTGAKPAVGATLELGDFPLDEILGVQSARSKGAIQAERTVRNTNNDVRWSRNAINTAWMHKFDMDVKATAKTFSWGTWSFSNAGLNAVLKDGTLDLKQLDGALYGGQVALSGKIASSGKERDPISLSGNALMQDVPIEEFVKAFSGSQLVKARGVMSFDTQLAATGLSPAALVFDLSGKGKATGKDFVIEGFDLARLSRAIAAPSSSGTENFTGLLDATMQGGSTQFSALDGVFTIAEGVINFDKFDLTGEAADVVNKGNINLPLWTIDMLSEVKLHEPEDAPSLKVTFKGPLDRPAQTFGQSAMDQFFQNQLEGLVLNPLINKLGEKGDLGAVGQGVLGNILGVQPMPKAAPAGSKKVVPTPLSPVAPQTQQKAAPTPAPVQQQQQAPVTQVTPESPAATMAVPEAVAPAPEPAPIAPEPAPAPAAAPEAVPPAPATTEPVPPAPVDPAAAETAPPTAEPEQSEQMDNLIEGIMQEDTGTETQPATTP